MNWTSISRNMIGVAGALFLVIGLAAKAAAPISARDSFLAGNEAYAAGGYDQAAEFLREAAAQSASPGILHNLGNAEWQSGRAGSAILAWERALWLDPFSRNTAANLRFARKAGQLDAPELAWYEICSTWLPFGWWPWLASITFWLALALVLLPGVLRWRRAGWQQGLAAACFAIFLLTIPAVAGVQTRAKFGIVLATDTPLRLTPTTEAQILTRLPAGESARLERERGGYVYIRTGTAAGWVESRQFGRIAEKPARTSR